MLGGGANGLPPARRTGEAFDYYRSRVEQWQEERRRAPVPVPPRAPPSAAGPPGENERRQRVMQRMAGVTIDGHEPNESTADDANSLSNIPAPSAPRGEHLNPRPLSFLSAASQRAVDAAALSDPALIDCGRIFCVSDIHTDHDENLRWCESLGRAPRRFANDTLICAGDVSGSKPRLRATLQALKGAFREVFFTPGNHDLWVVGRQTEGWQASYSTTKIDEMFALCASLGVRTSPAVSGGAIICPVLSWHHQSWDSEPDIVGWKDIPNAEMCMMDYHLCKWPAPLDAMNESVAKWFDDANDTCHRGISTLAEEWAMGAPAANAAAAAGDVLEAAVSALRGAHPAAPLITFSHFVPHLALNPEKRFLLFPPLAKASGSDYLARRLARLAPHCHVFGHTHFGWDATLSDGVRYVQAPLSYPEERAFRLGSVATGDDFPHATPPTPVRLYERAAGGFPPRYDAAWSNFYSRYPRLPMVNHVLAPYVASQGVYQKVDGVGEIGWFGEGAVDPLNGEVLGRIRAPIHFGPKSAVAIDLAKNSYKLESEFDHG